MDCLNHASSAVRHQWLEAAVAELRPRFADAGYVVPPNIRVSIGWTKYTPWKHCIGQCWSEGSSSDRYTEIFVSPELGTAEQTSRIIGATLDTARHLNAALLLSD
jgi:hypothetical protein